MKMQLAQLILLNSSTVSRRGCIYSFEVYLFVNWCAVDLFVCYVCKYVFIFQYIQEQTPVEASGPRDHIISQIRN